MGRFQPHPLPRFGTTLLPQLAVASLALLGLGSRAAELNDTGQTLCYSDTGTVLPCSVSGQDGRYGRDAAAAAGLLSKIGAGAAGFDYTKIANNGSALPADANLGTTPTAWACTLDNVTGLMWEMKTSSAQTSFGLRNTVQTFTWYSTAANNGGNAGSVGTDTCHGSLPGTPSQCNTASYVLAVNGTGLCGHSDWRLPTLKELGGLAISRAGINTTYFPNTQGNYWSASNYAANPADAWSVNFLNGFSSNAIKANSGYVRLVRGGQ